MALTLKHLQCPFTEHNGVKKHASNTTSIIGSKIEPCLSLMEREFLREKWRSNTYPHWSHPPLSKVSTPPTPYCVPAHIPLARFSRTGCHPAAALFRVSFPVWHPLASQFPRQGARKSEVLPQHVLIYRKKKRA